MSTKQDRIVWATKWLHSHVNVTKDKADTFANALANRFKIPQEQALEEVMALDLWETMTHACPNCMLEAQGTDALMLHFGVRVMKKRGKAYWQSWCKECKNVSGEGSGGEQINPVLPVEE